jgi:hypothetical protein
VFAPQSRQTIASGLSASLIARIALCGRSGVRSVAATRASSAFHFRTSP